MAKLIHLESDKSIRTPSISNAVGATCGRRVNWLSTSDTLSRITCPVCRKVADIRAAMNGEG